MTIADKEEILEAIGHVKADLRAVKVMLIGDYNKPGHGERIRNLEGAEKKRTKTLWAIAIAALGGLFSGGWGAWSN